MSLYLKLACDRAKYEKGHHIVLADAKDIPDNNFMYCPECKTTNQITFYRLATKKDKNRVSRLRDIGHSNKPA